MLNKFGLAKQNMTDFEIQRFLRLLFILLRRLNQTCNFKKVWGVLRQKMIKREGGTIVMPLTSTEYLAVKENFHAV